MPNHTEMVAFIKQREPCVQSVDISMAKAMKTMEGILLNNFYSFQAKRNRETESGMERAAEEKRE